MGISGINVLGNLWYVYALVTVAVHVTFAVGVLLDADKMKSAGGSTFIVPGWMWAIATLIGGIIPVIGYWFIHHSSLRKPKPPWIEDKIE